MALRIVITKLPVAIYPNMKKGFTLIELLVVISIIGILSALIITNIQGVRERARDARRKSNLDTIKTSMRLYYNDHQSFPLDLATIDATIYLNDLPLDPSSTTTNAISYEYLNVDDDSYVLVAKLENLSDQDIPESQSRCQNTYASYSNQDTTRDYVVCE